MTNRSHDFFDLVNLQSSLNAVTESLEDHLEAVAHSLQDSIRTSPWFPEAIKPSLLASTVDTHPSRYDRAGTAKSSIPNQLAKCYQWINHHRSISAAMVAFIATSAVMYWRMRKYNRRKRRAKRAKNGVRVEVVILAGSPDSPLTRSIAFDLERRGFIVLIPAQNGDEEYTVMAWDGVDIKPITWDVQLTESTSRAVDILYHYLEEQIDLPGANGASDMVTKYHLSGLVVLPPSQYKASNIGELELDGWKNALNETLAAPFSYIQSMLPLLKKYQASVVVLTPAINASLAPASRAIESVAVAGIDRFAATMRREHASIPLTQIKLGHLDLGRIGTVGQLVAYSEERSRAELTRLRLNERKGGHHSVSGSDIHRLHVSVFDGLNATGHCTTFVGRGGYIYDIIGRYMPDSAIVWMLKRNSEESKDMGLRPMFQGARSKLRELLEW